MSEFKCPAGMPKRRNLRADGVLEWVHVPPMGIAQNFTELCQCQPPVKAAATPIACSHCGKPDAGHVHGAAKPPAERCGGTPKNPRWWLSPSVGLGHRGWHDRTTACDTGMSHKRCHLCPGCPDCKPEEAASNPADDKCPRCGHHPGKHNQRGCNWHDEITCACTLPFGVEPKPEGDWALEAAKGIFPGSDPTLVNWATSIIRRHAPATEPLSEEEKE